MLGAIAGDIIGSIYEGYPIKTKEFPLFESRCCFTDDTVLTVAVADAITHRTSYSDRPREYYWRYPDAGYGGFFHNWARSTEPKPYGSYGNGSVMRVSPMGTVMRFNEPAAHARNQVPEFELTSVIASELLEASI